MVSKVKLRYSITTRQGGGEISNSYRRAWVAYWSRRLILTMLEGKVWLTCRCCCMAHACSLDRRKKQCTIYKAILSARTTIETGGKRSGNPVDSKKNKNDVISGRTVDVRAYEFISSKPPNPIYAWHRSRTSMEIFKDK